MGAEGSNQLPIPHIYRLPVELIAAILWLVDNPIQVSSIDVHLRNISLTTPALWTTIDLECHEDIYLLEVFLEQSHSSLLDVSIRFPYFRDVEQRPFDIPDVIYTMNLLRPHFNRICLLDLEYPWGSNEWRSTSFLSEGIEWAGMVIALFDAPAPELKTLLIESGHHDTLPDTFLSGFTPSLQKIDMRGIRFQFSAEFIHGDFSLRQLNIQVHNPKWDGISVPPTLSLGPLLAIIQHHASTLEVMRLHFNDSIRSDGWPFSSPIRTVTMPLLDTLALTASYLPNLEVIHAPRLRTLDLDISFEGQDEHDVALEVNQSFNMGLASLYPFLIRHAHHIENIRISLSHWNGPGSVDFIPRPIFSNFPQLRHLQVYSNLSLDHISFGIHADNMETFDLQFARGGIIALGKILALFARVSPSLRHIIIRSADRNLVDATNLDNALRVHLPKLCRIQMVGVPAADTLLKHIDAPCLAHDRITIIS